MKRITFTQFLSKELVEKLTKYIPRDKVDHIILGLVINPLIYFLQLYFFEVSLESSWMAFGYCLAYHLGVEGYQMITKTGKGEWWDVLAGQSSAILMIQPILLILLN